MRSSLSKYHTKRHFGVSPEPAGRVLKRKGWSYVIQKHDASHLHYDFRLELDGVLKSWAVPKGPSLDPTIKRLAVEVEDHPVDYGTFEGIIPEGEYGGGTVLLWDHGTWEPLGDPHEGLRTGRLKFQLHGEKLRGVWMLVRSKPRPGATKPQWLLFKERDGEARAASEGDILEEQPMSVVSGRGLGEIASAKERVWSSNSKSEHAGTKAAAAKRATRKTTKSKSPTTAKSAGGRTKVRKTASPSIAGAKKKSLPKTVEVQLATLTKEPPNGDEWLHEIKLDGYRMICRKDGGKIQFISRNQQDWTDRLRPLVKAVADIPARQVILDGELIALTTKGISDFQTLQNAFREGCTTELKYFVFDLLYLNGQSLMDVPLELRKEVLADLIAGTESDSPIQYSDHVEGSGEEFQKQACRLHLEGTISKRRDQPYRSGRGFDWLKTKCVMTEEFVIGGYTEPSGSRSGFGALLVGYHDHQGKLRYAGKVGTGFDERDLTRLTNRLRPLERKTSPFIDVQHKTGPVRTAHWVEPELVGQFTFAGRTNDNRLRHASFQGLREDKPAEEVTMDRPVAVETAVRKSTEQADKKSRSTSMKSTSRKANKSGSGVTKSAEDYDASAEEFAGVRLTSPDKVLYPDSGITKLDLAKYYYDIADWILPQIAHRPVVLVRCPEGRKKECFYQKHPGVGTPDFLRQIPIQEKQRKDNYLVVDDAKDLIALAQMGALEIHAWGSREDKLENPDRLIFDLDPALDVPWERVIDGARQIRQFLDELGLESFVKTTGGKGLHLIIPIDRRHDWDDAKAFCKQVADSIVAADPDHYTANMSKAARPGKIFVDYLRNGRGATSVVPYSTRSKPGATVSTPLTWDELNSQITSDHFNIRNIRDRLTSLREDPWKELRSIRQSLTAPMKKLNSISPSVK